MPIKIVFLGTPDITLKSFDFFIKSADYEVLALVTQKAKQANRGKKIVERNITKMARENNIHVFEPDKISKEPDVIKQLKALKPDFFITLPLDKFYLKKLLIFHQLQQSIFMQVYYLNIEEQTQLLNQSLMVKLKPV